MIVHPCVKVGHRQANPMQTPAANAAGFYFVEETLKQIALINFALGDFWEWVKAFRLRLCNSAARSSAGINWGRCWH